MTISKKQDPLEIMLMAARSGIQTKKKRVVWEAPPEVEYTPDPRIREELRELESQIDETQANLAQAREENPNIIAYYEQELEGLRTALDALRVSLRKEKENLSQEQAQSDFLHGKEILEKDDKNLSQEQGHPEVLHGKDPEDSLSINLEIHTPLEVVNTVNMTEKIEVIVNREIFEVEKLKKRRRTKNKVEEIPLPPISPKDSGGSISFRIKFVRCGKRCRCRRGELHGGYLTVRWTEGGRQREKIIGRANRIGAIG